MFFQNLNFFYFNLKPGILIVFTITSALLWIRLTWKLPNPAEEKRVIYTLLTTVPIGFIIFGVHEFAHYSGDLDALINNVSIVGFHITCFSKSSTVSHCVLDDIITYFEQLSITIGAIGSSYFLRRKREMKF